LCKTISMLSHRHTHIGIAVWVLTTSWFHVMIGYASFMCTIPDSTMNSLMSSSSTTELLHSIFLLGRFSFGLMKQVLAPWIISLTNSENQLDYISNLCVDQNGLKTGAKLHNRQDDAEATRNICKEVNDSGPPSCRVQKLPDLIQI